MLVVSWFLCGLLCFLLYHYLFCKLFCNKKFLFTKSIFVLSVIIGFIYYFISNSNYLYLRPYIIHIYIFISFVYIYKENIVKTILGLLNIFVLVLLSEMLFGILMIYIFDVDFSISNQAALNYLISNLCIFSLCFVFSKVKIINSLFGGIISWYNQDEIKSLTILVSLVLTMAIFILYNNFTKMLPSSLLLFTNIFCIGVFVFVIGFFKEKSNNNRIVTEYDNLLNYVKVYENEIEDKSKNQHEYKNQLILIRGLISPKNKKAIQYIDNVLENDNGFEDISWLSKLKYVPQGGLKGLIYYKIQEMLKNDIKIFVDISPQLKKVKDNKNISQNLEDISKIIGIYLDNAIQAVGELDEKYIIIEFYLEDNNIIFSLSNNYSGVIDVVRLDKEGYTTKGTGHGYGLSLVKDIISKNDKLKQKRELNGIYYVQKLYIKK